MMNRIYLYWCNNHLKDGKENFGDLLPKYIIEKISKRKIIQVIHPSMRRYKHVLKHYLTIGSILEAANENSIVWGSGIIRENDFIKEAKFLAVRGPKTRKRLLELGYKVPEIYGDPAILLSDVYPNKIEPKYELGIIPHYVDYESIQTVFKDDASVKVIDLTTTDVEKTLDEILECKAIISSSLHGVIVPHTYGIPALWVKFSDKLGGDNIKFFDYFESVNLHYSKIVEINSDQVHAALLKEILESNADLALPKKEVLTKIKNDLMKSNPF